MKDALALLAAAGLALAGGLGAEARLIAPEVDDAAILGEDIPRKLSDFGFFVHAREQVPTLGVTAYELNTPLYSDGADKLRFIYLPDGAVAEADGENLLAFPIGTVLIKTFAFGEGEDRHLIETRLLLHRADGWLALPYRWNEEQTEAVLALAGARLSLETPAGKTISYRVPNKNQCKTCHGLEGEVVPIGPKARNLSGEWLAAFHAAGELDAIPEGGDQLIDWDERDVADPARAARAYLDVNCAHCHRPGGSASNSGLDLRWEQDDPGALGIMKRPVAAGRGAGGLAFSIEPGRPDRSIMLHRMRSTDPGVAMPELGKSTVDEEGVAVVAAWIEGMDAS